jgi:signal transduction histidine kinase/DNA-binding response OmpR family regulator
MIAEPKINILVVEDDTIDRISVERHLKEAMPGCRCILVDTVELARLAIKMESFDVIVTDYKIYDRTGFDILEMRPDAPVIFMTGKGDEETAVKALNSGAYDYLVKDKDSRFIKIMPKTIENAVKRYRAEAIAHTVQFEESIAGVFTIGLDGQLIDCNRAFANVLGYISVNDIKMDLKSGDPCCDIKLVSDVQAKGFIRHARACFYGKDDKQVCGLVNAKVVQEEPSGQGLITGTMLDLTEHLAVEERKNLLENQLQTMQKLEALGTLAGGIAHDFNNLLGAIQGFTEIARVDAEGNKPVVDNLDEVLDACKHAKNLVQQIMSFSQCREPDQKLLSLTELVSEHISLLNPTLPPGVKVVSKNHLDEDLQAANIMGDPVQLAQVFINLCTNAMHAMKNVGGNLHIEIRAVRRGDEFYKRNPSCISKKYFCLSVRDNGIGMTESVRAKIFEPFFTTKVVGEGTGMGLAVVHGIVRNHHGIIELDSIPHKGSEFRVYLARSAETARQAKKTHEPAKQNTPPQVGARERVLLLDDDATSLRVMERLLGRLNYQVKTFNQPRKAITYIQQQSENCDLIISDFMMPEMTGVEVARELRRAGIRIPFVIYTGYDEYIQSGDLEILDIRKVLLKPVGLRELGEALPDIIASADLPEK